MDARRRRVIGHDRQANALPLSAAPVDTAPVSHQLDSPLPAAGVPPPILVSPPFTLSDTSLPTTIQAPPTTGDTKPSGTGTAAVDVKDSMRGQADSDEEKSPLPYVLD